MTTPRERLLAEIAEARNRISDFTRMLDESPDVEEHDTTFEDELKAAREHFIELMRQLAELG